MGDTTLSATEVSVDNLVIEAGEVVKRTFLTGQGTLLRGTACTKDGAGKYVKTIAAGSIDLIVKDDVDTSAGDAIEYGYYTGVYKQSEVEAATGVTITEAMQDLARSNGLYIGTRE